MKIPLTVTRFHPTTEVVRIPARFLKEGVGEDVVNRYQVFLILSLIPGLPSAGVMFFYLSRLVYVFVAPRLYVLEQLKNMIG